mgnify:CR=1 FL=1
MKRVIRGTLVWLLAVVVTVSLAAFQRLTGPSHPLRGAVRQGGEELRFKLPRSHGGPGGLRVELAASEAVSEATLRWRRFPTDEAWRELPMWRQGPVWVGSVPHQPPAGKVEYRILLRSDEGSRPVVVPSGEAVVARFRGGVPAPVLISHIVAMFLAMLLATRAVLVVLTGGGPPRVTVVLTGLLLVAGGLVLGPVVQKYAFGAFWTGWPVGDDWTDTKTLVAFLAWLPPTILAFGGRRSLGPWVLAGWVVMMGVFCIPHSSHGSELDWSRLEADRPEPAAEGPRRPRAPSSGEPCYS